MKMPDFSDAACAEVGVDFFFPDSREQESAAVKTAIGICSTCPLYTKCLDYSLAVKVEGIWAGTTEAQRRTMRKQRGIVGIPLTAQYLDYFLSQSDDAKAHRKLRAKKSAKTRKEKQDA
jgi:WhiB family redox-sensing transcriptional regulator